MDIPGSNTCAVSSATDNTSMDEFCALYRQRRGLPNVNTSILGVQEECEDGKACVDNTPTVMNSLMDQNVKTNDDSKSITNKKRSRHGDSRFPRGEKRYIEENMIEGIVKKTKSQKKLRVYARKRSAINTKKVTKDKNNKIGQRRIDGCGIPIGSNVKRDCRYTEHSCPPLEIKTQKEIFRQSMEYFLQSNKQSKEIPKFVSEWNTELMSQTSNVYMLHSNHLQNQLTGGTDVTSRQYEHSGDYNTVDSPRPPPSNEETMANDTIGDGNEAVATSEEQRTHDLQAERTLKENDELQQSNNNEDGDRASEVCQSAYPVRNPAFADEPARIATYMYWGKGDPSKHGEAGFFFTGNDDILRCFHCDIGIGGWNLTSDPWTEHARYSPACPFLRTEKSQKWIDSIQAIWKQTYKPKHPDYQQMDARQKSFEHAGWRQMDCSLSRKRLAEAGCFFEGDHIRCHYCGGNLREDGSTEEPWIIHAKTFPFCKFVQMSKGDDFIETHINDQTELELPGHYLPVRAGLEGHKFDIREERDPMATATVQCLLEMGYDRNTITEAIKTFISRTGRRDFDAKEMVDIIQEYEEALFENKQLRNRLICKSCGERDWINIFVPCGHLVCQQCSAGLAICAICQKAISETVKVYF